MGGGATLADIIRRNHNRRVTSSDLWRSPISSVDSEFAQCRPASPICKKSHPFTGDERPKKAVKKQRKNLYRGRRQ